MEMPEVASNGMTEVVSDNSERMTEVSNDRMTEVANAVCGWLVKKTFNTIVFVIIVVMSFLTARSLLRNIKNVDNYLHQLSPYNSLGDIYPGDNGSGLRMDFPPPIFIQVFQDLSLAIEVEINDVVFDERVPIEVKPNKPVVEKPEKGASLSYVNTFCREVFGSSSNMETCRTKLVDKCNVDIMNWFNVDPKKSTAQIKNIQSCLSKQFNKPATFMEKLQKSVEEKEVFMKQRVDKRGDTRFWKAGIFIGIAVGLILTTWWTVSNYKKYNSQIRAEILRQKLSGIDESIANITKNSVCDEIVEEAFIKCVKFSTAVFDDAFDHHKLFGYMSLVIVDHSVEELVDAFDQNEDLVLPEPPKKELRVDLSWQEEMLHLVRVGLPQVHHCEVDFDVDGDDEGANEENIFVTGFEINPDNPLELRYWRKRLKEIRHVLAQDAKDRLMAKYPTLRALGWFKPVKHDSETESEGEDEDEALDVIEEEENDEKASHRRGSFMAKNMNRSMSVMDPPSSRRGSAATVQEEIKNRKVSVNVPSW